MAEITLAITGNPNCGKTTLFNALTGGRQHVANWPGVTVDRKTGLYRYGDDRVEVVDLPGVYSLGVFDSVEALDEKIARDYILSGAADVLVDVVDATNLEHNLYLTAQLVEMRIPMVLALNMMDAAQGQGLQIDAEALAARLGCPVVPMVARRREGLEQLMAAIAVVAGERRPPAAQIPYPGEVERAVGALQAVTGQAAGQAKVDARWLAVKLLECDGKARALAAGAADALLAELQPGIEQSSGEEAEFLIADGRYGFVHALVAETVRKGGRARRSVSDLVDRVVLDRWLGVPVFLGVMYLMFMFAINLGGAFVDVFDILVGTILVDGLAAAIAALGGPQWLTAVLAQGVGGGIQLVATFVPIIGFLYLFLSVLEKSGYMARAAFVMNRLMQVIGLPGNAFVPLIVGFGCNVPAVMASRSLPTQRDRMLTVAMTPFMSCGARLTIYAMFAAAFFPTGGQNLVFGLYLAGIAVALATGFALKRTVLRGENTPFVMELPPYRLPALRDVLLHAWIRLKSFLTRAGRVIVMVVVVLSFLNSWGTDGSFGNENTEKSMLSVVGRTIVPAFAPMGIRAENWPAAVGIFTGVFAKEAVVGTLDALYSEPAGGAAAAEGAAPDAPGGFDPWAGIARAFATIPANLAAMKDLVTDPLGLGVVGAEDLAGAAAAQGVSLGTLGTMAARFDGDLGAFAYLLFILLYLPCVATLGAISRELGPRPTLFIAAWTSGVAYAAAVTAYQLGSFAAHPLSSAAWLAAVAAMLAGTVLVLRRLGSGAPAAVPAE
ncbi:MAG: Fe(2+) transporter permease subunit FeoB [Rhodospirillales bacterium]|nr:Fe(2+) transporter permease subunit FeoB [Rhodospirillales bacterium]MDH3912967.1 Fe(2+) transporter permease subunit FeoB [Rhodospirillales bacterium]MDH3917635.1 Fe(2+) transporter permease subunit FeoB [Rhodospirillales bacterium]MDH3967468.1 Fe(2+) transporter permease subunit FeoB [Rhodospirillales bacterium]